MAKIKSSNNKNRIVAEWMAGEIHAGVTKVRKGYTFVISVNHYVGLNAIETADFADALYQLCKTIGKMQDKDIKFAGTPRDPNEPELGSAANAMVKYQVYAENTDCILNFVHYAATGQVRAEIPPMIFKGTDLATAVQFAFICNQMANLMKVYGKQKHG